MASEGTAAEAARVDRVVMETVQVQVRGRGPVLVLVLVLVGRSCRSILSIRRRALRR